MLTNKLILERLEKRVKNLKELLNSVEHDLGRLCEEYKNPNEDMWLLEYNEWHNKYNKRWQKNLDESQEEALAKECDRYVKKCS